MKQISVNENYYSVPDYDDESESLYAQFLASYSITVEAENENEAYNKGIEAFEKTNFGDYEYMDGWKLEAGVEKNAIKDKNNEDIER